MTQVTVKELHTDMGDLLYRVRYMKERFVVTKNGRVMATLGPCDTAEGGGTDGKTKKAKRRDAGTSAAG